MTTQATYETIEKPRLEAFAVRPNLYDYDAQRASFSWEQIRQELVGLPGGGLNVAHEAIDRHLKTPLRTKTAMLWVGKQGEEELYTFEDMARQSNRFANVLRQLGLTKGDRVFVFLDRIPELYFAAFGTIKAGCIFGPLFSAFGPEAVLDRLQDSEAKVLLTSPDLKPKIDAIRDQLPALEHVIVVDHRNPEPELGPGEKAWQALMDAAPDSFETVHTDPEDLFIMHYTSGTTGKPKGAAHAQRAVYGHFATGRYVLDLHDDDLYWCTADPGWVTGTSYGMFAPWTNGVTNLIYEGGFRASAWYEVIQKYRVTVWYTAPTAIRMLMKAGDDVPKRYDLSSVRYAMSVGEPLNPEAVVWGERVLGFPFHDNWWQTETGSIMIANYPIMPIRPGSMGRPMLGIEPAIVDDEGTEVPAGQEGNLVLKPGWPSMFKTYWKKEEMYQSRFKNGWYYTGDRARKDEDGYFWFVGRADDVINTSGHLVGPFEVESVLIEHPAVAEAGVIGKPDAMAGEIVKAFVAVKDGFEASDKIRGELMQLARQKLGTVAAPREIDFVPSLPKTRSGKIMRRLLKARELGLPEGDTSTLEDD
ncbi:MAG TPA: acetate--CoA ligase [Dehalococcoidia bacterium]|nr:acetate--CoA ligase [Dehalococcoidia bacterium]